MNINDFLPDDEELPQEPAEFAEAFDLASQALTKHEFQHGDDEHETIFNYEALSELYDKPQPRLTGESNRVSLQVTIQPETDEAFRDFVETLTGEEIRAGRGVMSTVAELGLRVLMAVVADYKIAEVAGELRGSLVSDFAVNKVRENIIRFADKL
jgi:hypothetical protein